MTDKDFFTDDDRRKALAAEARYEARLCRGQFMNCCYQNDGINKMLLNHATLFRQLARAIDGPDEEDKALDSIARKFEEKFGGGNQDGSSVS